MQIFVNDKNLLSEDEFVIFILIVLYVFTHASPVRCEKYFSCFSYCILIFIFLKIYCKV